MMPCVLFICSLDYSVSAYALLFTNEPLFTITFLILSVLFYMRMHLFLNSIMLF